MAHRNKKPIFIDEPIQWHLANSRHDRCPICGMETIGYLSKTQRTCLNSICFTSITLQKPSTEWLHDKMLGETFDQPDLLASLWLGPPEQDIHSKLKLDDALDESRSEIAVILRKESFSSGGAIYWCKGAPWPFFYDQGRETQVCKPGSLFWILLVQTRWWYPSRKLSPLELLARQAPDAKNIREDMAFVVTA